MPSLAIWALQLHLEDILPICPRLVELEPICVLGILVEGGADEGFLLAHCVKNRIEQG
jgi:hypothetical protein